MTAQMRQIPPPAVSNSLKSVGGSWNTLRRNAAQDCDQPEAPRQQQPTAAQGPLDRRGRRLTLPMSTSRGFETSSGPVEGRVVGCVVLPAPPHHPCPRAGEDSHGVWVVAAAGDGLPVDLGGPRRGAAGVVGEGGHGLPQPLVAGPPEADV